MKATDDKGFLTDTLRGSVVVKCTADWCQPCKTVQPIIDKVARKFPSTHFLQLDVDENPRVVNAYNIQAVPTLLFFRDGKYQGMLAGGFTEIRLTETIQQLIGG